MPRPLMCTSSPQLHKFHVQFHLFFHAFRCLIHINSLFIVGCIPMTIHLKQHTRVFFAFVFQTNQVFCHPNDSPTERLPSSKLTVCYGKFRPSMDDFNLPLNSGNFFCVRPDYRQQPQGGNKYTIRTTIFGQFTPPWQLGCQEWKIAKSLPSKPQDLWFEGQPSRLAQCTTASGRSMKWKNAEKKWAHFLHKSFQGGARQISSWCINPSFYADIFGNDI